MYQQKYDGYNAARSHSRGYQQCASAGETTCRCRYEGCDRVAELRARYCEAHAGGLRRCAQEACTKIALTNDDYCVSHGTRSRVGARIPYPSTPGVNVGPRGLEQNGSGVGVCQTSGGQHNIVGDTQRGTNHEGVNRCQYDGCNKFSLGSTPFCKSHGGGLQFLLGERQLSSPAKPNHCGARTAKSDYFSAQYVQARAAKASELLVDVRRDERCSVPLRSPSSSCSSPTAVSPTKAFVAKTAIMDQLDRMQSTREAVDRCWTVMSPPSLGTHTSHHTEDGRLSVVQNTQTLRKWDTDSRRFTGIELSRPDGMDKLRDSA